MKKSFFTKDKFKSKIKDKLLKKKRIKREKMKSRN